MKKAILVLSLALALNAAAQPPHQRSIWYSPHSGITGEVFLRVTSPVHGKGPPLGLVPYQASLAVYSQTGRLITEVTTDAQGHFQIGLRPGTYVVAALVATPPAENGPPPNVPVDGPKTIQVRFKEYTPITVEYYNPSIR